MSAPGPRSGVPVSEELPSMTEAPPPPLPHDVTATVNATSNIDIFSV
jgi:hypothetical protein